MILRRWYHVFLKFLKLYLFLWKSLFAYFSGFFPYRYMCNISKNNKDIKDLWFCWNSEDPTQYTLALLCHWVVLSFMENFKIFRGFPHLTNPVSVQLLSQYQGFISLSYRTIWFLNSLFLEILLLLLPYNYHYLSLHSPFQ